MTQNESFEDFDMENGSVGMEMEQDTTEYEQPYSVVPEREYNDREPLVSDENGDQPKRKRYTMSEKAKQQRVNASRQYRELIQRYKNQSDLYEEQQLQEQQLDIQPPKLRRMTTHFPADPKPKRGAVYKTLPNSVPLLTDNSKDFSSNDIVYEPKKYEKTVKNSGSWVESDKKTKKLNEKPVEPKEKKHKEVEDVEEHEYAQTPILDKVLPQKEKKLEKEDNSVDEISISKTQQDATSEEVLVYTEEDFLKQLLKNPYKDRGGGGVSQTKTGDTRHQGLEQQFAHQGLFLW